MSSLVRLFGVLLGSTLLAAPALACTTFLLSEGKEVRVGKSYDWNLSQGLVPWNKRGVKKRAIVLKPTDRPAEWVSRYASLTFNQYGREFPNGGLNEAGLVVEIMWLDSSAYPAPDNRPAVGELPWIQYQLDNRASVAEAVAHAEDVRVSNQYGKVHYLLCDRTAACAVFEYVGGKLVVRSGADLPVPVLTNNTYAESLDYLKQTGQRPPAGTGSLARFARTAALVRSPGSGLKAGDLTTRALSMLDGVRVEPLSKWNIVYDPVALRVSFRTSDHPELRTVELAAFDRSCRAPVKMLDLQAALSGDVTNRFVDYQDKANERLIEQTTAPIAKSLPPGALKLLASYPSKLACTKE
jgi:choloylglycine hydrolase